MRFLHTSDWHLGRLFHGVHLTMDQSYVLDQLIDVVAEARVDAVVIAGDIYDRAVPPPDAVTLLDDTLARIVIGLHVPVLMIAGNHDSPERLGFGARIFSPQKVHVSGILTRQTKTVLLEDEHGTVHFYLVPYAEPASVREQIGDPAAVDHSSAARILLDRIRSVHPQTRRSVVVAHAFVAGGVESESERPLSVGGSGAVAANHFSGFNYVALGHLHRAQQAGAETVTYSGSLMKYSFSEAGEAKGINLVEINGKGEGRVEQIKLTPRRDVRRIEGCLSQLLNHPAPGQDDYLEVTLLDKGAILDPIGKLRQVYPNVLHLRRPEILNLASSRRTDSDHRRIADLDLFSSFFAEVTGDELTEAQAAAYCSTAEKLKIAEQEG